MQDWCASSLWEYTFLFSPFLSLSTPSQCPSYNLTLSFFPILLPNSSRLQHHPHSFSTSLLLSYVFLCAHSNSNKEGVEFHFDRQLYMCPRSLTFLSTIFTFPYLLMLLPSSLPLTVPPSVALSATVLLAHFCRASVVEEGETNSQGTSLLLTIT